MSLPRLGYNRMTASLGLAALGPASCRASERPTGESASAGLRGPGSGLLSLPAARGPLGASLRERPSAEPQPSAPRGLSASCQVPTHRNQEASGLCLKRLRLGQLCPRHFLADHWEPQDSTGRGRGDAPVFTNDKSLTETRAGISASCLPLLRPRLARLSAEGRGVWVRRGHRGLPRGVPEGSSPTGRPAQASRFGPCGKFQPHI